MKNIDTNYHFLEQLGPIHYGQRNCNRFGDFTDAIKLDLSLILKRKKIGVKTLKELADDISV